jgi:hypothetical protein
MPEPSTPITETHAPTHAVEVGECAPIPVLRDPGVCLAHREHTGPGPLDGQEVIVLGYKPAAEHTRHHTLYFARPGQYPNSIMLSLRQATDLQRGLAKCLRQARASAKARTMAPGYVWPIDDEPGKLTI